MAENENTIPEEEINEEVELPSEFDEEEDVELEEDLDDELFEEELEPVVDPTQVITLRTSGGQTRYIPAGDPMTLAEIKGLSGLTFGAVTFYYNAQVIDDTTIIPVGGVVTAIGNVKGG
jgi:hypothetical protein